MSEKKNTEITETGSFAALANMDMLNEAMADDCQGLEFSFDRVNSLQAGAQPLRFLPLRAMSRRCQRISQG